MQLAVPVWLAPEGWVSSSSRSRTPPLLDYYLAELRQREGRAVGAVAGWQTAHLLRKTDRHV